MVNESGITRSEKRRLGGWLPANEAALAQFRQDLAARAAKRAADTPPATVVQELAALVDHDPALRMALTRAIDEATRAGYVLGYSSIDELLRLIDYLLTFAPPFCEHSLIICPLNGLLDWLMCMPSGYALFRHPPFNAQLKRVLNAWCGFLSGPYSRVHLNTAAPTGWFCPAAAAKIHLPDFQYDPQQPHGGFASWNDFFTRRLRPDARPVAAPADDKIIVSACEASPYHLQQNVKVYDRFWIKSQPYSLHDIFTAGQRELAQRFAGGSIYQAFLSAYNYHRWHAPVSGTIVKAYQVDGTYYAETAAEGVDQRGLHDSQGYLTAMATRAVIVIDCHDTAIGQVGCVFVGMGEVSSCVIEALPGQRVEKGDEIGYFQYGGSTYCLIFEPDASISFVPQPPFHDERPPLKVNAHVATAR